MTNFLGYGSPEKLEAAIKAQEDERLVVYTEGLCFASVCSDLAVEEVAQRMKTRISGTTHGWGFSKNETFKDGEPNPCPCNRKPNTHKHFLFEC